MLKKLGQLADHLDKIGLSVEADYVDALMEKIAQEKPEESFSEDFKINMNPRESAMVISKMIVDSSQISGRIASSLEEEISSMLEKHPDLTKSLHEAIAEASIQEGMTSEAYM